MNRDIYVVVPDDTPDISKLYGEIRVSLWKKKVLNMPLIMQLHKKVTRIGR